MTDSDSEDGDRTPPRKKRSYAQKYCPKWEKDKLLEPWLRSVPSNTKLAHCIFCKENLNAKLSDLKTHATSKKHTRAAAPFSDARQAKLPFKPFDLKLSLKTAAIEATLVLFVVCHAAVRVIDHLTDCTKKLFNDVAAAANVQLHRTKATGIIRNIFYPHFKEILRADIGDSPYSLLIDESTDISVHKQLGLCIRYYSKKAMTVVCTYLCLVRLKGGDARSVVAGVKQSLAEFDIPITNLRGIGTDNASVMTGVNAGVYAMLKEELPYLVLVRCVCHSLQLAVTEAMKTLPKHLEFILTSTYAWFSRSSNRQGSYGTLYKTMNEGEEPLKIVKAAKTRWLSVEVAIQRIVKQWATLKEHFAAARRVENNFTTDLLHSFYVDVKNKIYFIFLLSILEQAQHINKAFQARDADVTKLTSDLEFLVAGLARRVVTTGCRADLLREDISNYLHPNPTLGYAVEEMIREARNSKSMTGDDEIALRKRCVDFVVKLVKELQQRLPESFDRLSKVSMLSPSNALRVHKNSIVPVAQLLGKTADVITKLEHQWQKLTLVEWGSAYGHVVAFWVEVLNYRDASGLNPFQELADLAIDCLVLPWSNADIERVFSEMKVVKTPHRNRMLDDLLNALLLTRASMRRLGTCCRGYDFPETTLKLIGTMAAYAPSRERDAVPAAAAVGVIPPGDLDPDEPDAMEWAVGDEEAAPDQTGGR